MLCIKVCLIQWEICVHYLVMNLFDLLASFAFGLVYCHGLGCRAERIKQ